MLGCMQECIPALCNSEGIIFLCIFCSHQGAAAHERSTKVKVEEAYWCRIGSAYSAGKNFTTTVYTDILSMQNDKLYINLLDL